MKNNEKPLIIISTVGTSLFTNYNQEKKDFKFQEFWDKLVWKDVHNGVPKKDKGRKAFSENDWEKIQEQQAKKASIADSIGQWVIKKGDDASAELKSIKQIVGFTDKAKVVIHLLTTSTFDGHLCGWILKKELERQGYSHSHIQLKRIEGLTINSGSDFQTTALNELTKYISENAENNTILNITGGYKALIPFMTIIGQIKGLQLKYIYEDSNDLITVGNLPINLDWDIVEALKPCWKNYFLKENLQDIALEVFENNAQFDNVKQRYILSQNCNEEVKKKPVELHQVLKLLIDYNLVTWEKAELKESAFAKIIANIPVDGNSGFIMEYILYKYFDIYPQKNLLVKDYETTKPLQLKHRFFKLNSTKEVELTDNGTKQTEIGDMDIPLIKKTGNEKVVYVWGESKAFNAACDYQKEIGKNSDYLYQLIARTRALHETIQEKNKREGIEENIAIELLFIVFKFTIKNVTHDVGLLSPYLEKVINHLKKINTQTMPCTTTFRALGIKIPIDFDEKTGKLNFTNFYNGKNIKEWNDKWEELPTS